jgi:hypothetical protein
MAAPKGNQYAKGNPNSGRPSQWTEEKLAEFGNQFLEWAQKDTSLVMMAFAGEHTHDPDVIYDLAEKDKVFSRIHQRVKAIIGARREALAMSGNGSHVVWSKTARMYDDRYDKNVSREIYDKAKQETKGKLDAIGGDTDNRGAILKYLESQKL